MVKEHRILIKKVDVPKFGDQQEPLSHQLTRVEGSLHARQGALEGRRWLLQHHERRSQIVVLYSTHDEQGQEVRGQLVGSGSLSIETDSTPQGALKQAQRAKEGVVKLPVAKKRIEASIEQLTQGMQEGKQKAAGLEEALVTKASEYKRDEATYREALDALRESHEVASPDYKGEVKGMLDRQEIQFITWSEKQLADFDLQRGLEILRQRTNAEHEQTPPTFDLGMPLIVPRVEPKSQGQREGNGNGRESKYSPPGYLAEVEVDRQRLDALVLLALEPQTPLRELMQGATSPFTGGPIRGGGVLRALGNAIHTLQYQYIRADAFGDHGETMRPEAREAWEVIEEAVLKRMRKTREDFKNQTRAKIVQAQVRRLLDDAPRLKDIKPVSREEIAAKEGLVKEKVAEVAHEARAQAFSHAEFVALAYALSMKHDALVSIEGHDVSFVLPDSITDLCGRVIDGRHKEELPSPEVMRETRIEAIAKLILLISDVQSEDPFKIAEGIPARQADELRLLDWCWKVNTYGELRDALASILVSDLTSESTQDKDTTKAFVPTGRVIAKVTARRGERVGKRSQKETEVKLEQVEKTEESGSRIHEPIPENILMKLVTIMDFSETRSNSDLIDILGEDMVDKNGRVLIPYQLFGALAGQMAYLSGRVYLHNRGKEKNVLTPDEEGAWNVMQGIIADFRTNERRENDSQADTVELNSISRQEVLFIFNKRLEEIFGEYGYKVTIPSAKKAASQIVSQEKGTSEEVAVPIITRERAIIVLNLAAEDAVPGELQDAWEYYESLNDEAMKKFDEDAAHALEMAKGDQSGDKTIGPARPVDFPHQEFDVTEVEVVVRPEVIARARELSLKRAGAILIDSPDSVSPEDMEAAVYWFNNIATSEDRAALGRSRRVEIPSRAEEESQEDDSVKVGRLRKNDKDLDANIDALLDELAAANLKSSSTVTSGMIQDTFRWGRSVVDGDLAQDLGVPVGSGREYTPWEALALGYVFQYGERLKPNLKRKFIAKYIEERYADWLRRRQRRS